MSAKYILALLGALFLVLAIAGMTKNGGRIGPASRAWLIIALIFAAVSAWLFVGSPG